MTSSSAIKLGIVVVGFATAGIVFTVTGAEESERSVPADADELNLVCTDCGHHFTQAAAALEAQVMNTPQPKAATGESKPGFRFAGRPPKVVPCPECSENAGVLATACPEHGEFFPSKEMDGRRGTCPQCNRPRGDSE